MKPINFDKSIDSESITWLLNELHISGEEAAIVYIKSEGGDSYSTPPLIHYINEITDKKFITLVGYGYISSASFDIFWLTDCKKELIPGTYAVLHKTSFEINENSKEHLEYKKSIEVANEEMHVFLKESKLFSAQEIKNYNNHKDIVVGYEKLCKLLKIS